MLQKNVQVIGICRWSYPADPADFRRTPDDLASARAALYADHRMRHRLYLLEEVVLPALRAQTDPDFTLVLLMGDQMPEPYRTQVLDLVADVPQVEVVFEPEGQPQQDLIRKVMLDRRDENAAAVAEFRLDDDDAIAVDFVAETRAVFAEIHPLFERNGLFGVDYTRGVVLITSRDDCKVKPITARWWAPGMVVYIRPDLAKSVLDFHHMRLWHEMTILMHADKPMFVRGIHHSNDSSIEQFGKRSGRYPLDRKNTQAFMEERFAINLRRVKRRWIKSAEGFREPRETRKSW
ncbi:glycosyltransferase [Sinisalibacter lacisalsi]|uniref:DNA-directed RNA polymerase subunit beta n=1 Tax=Sinisalibacter lacisalsi TaxID=1526570 RepID=A0ABQ1Q9F1_9RHOB|nr:glycosyltransferase [Sinisalibacter lacisalsi]GGD19546.1 DNA-directed RNA polymerase subunit beta' [Sinisalibacter lacisalsi]